MRILLITPPLLQLNTPYPATPYLASFLEARGFDVLQADASLDLALRLFSRRGIHEIAAALPAPPARESAAVRWFRNYSPRYANTIDSVIAFLQSRNPNLAQTILAGSYLPEGPRFKVLTEIIRHAQDMRRWAGLRLIDDDAQTAKYFASLYIDDLADAIREGIDPWFGLARYAETLTASLPDFAPLREAIEAPPTLISRILDKLTATYLKEIKPDVIGFTLPFPGTLYGALRMARRIKQIRPKLPIILGGGYVNTELRSLADPAIFDYCDFITFDDGFLPILRIVQGLSGSRPRPALVRTLYRRGGQIIRAGMDSSMNMRRRSLPPPIYAGLKLQRYLNLAEMPNPMHSLWSDRRWNKFILAHGCYWRRCRFCDTSLDYISRYDEPDTGKILDDLAAVIRATGFNGFHFIDEAASPALLHKLAEGLIARRLEIEWWTNIRFEKAFKPELAALLARSGCIAVCGGLETACDRTLRLMQKGIDRATAAQACRAFADAGIMVHAYLMYGFPTQTVAETISALDFVRGLFKAGVLRSAYWHRFALTVHSPMHNTPDAYGIKLAPVVPRTFASNEAAWLDPGSNANDALGKALHAATYNYMFGAGLERPVRVWFAGMRRATRRHPRYHLTGIPL